MEAASRSKTSVTNSVAKTAMDAINAKLSLMECNYKPVPQMALQMLGNKEGSSEEPPHENLQHDSQTIPRDSLELYSQLLHRMKKEGKVRRQTPLVNAGYAVRVSAISSTIVRFIQTKQNFLPSSKINLMFLGCGLDVMGVWASVVSSSSTCSPSECGIGLNANVQVFEVDCMENCDAKRNAFLEAEILHSEQGNESKGNDDVHHGTILKGRIKTDQYTNCNDCDHNYTLLAADLRDIQSLQNAIDVSSFDPTVPTIVISELVLAYLNLGGTGKYIDGLITYISSSLCCSDDSMFLAYEPVIPESSSNVVSGYTKDYFGQFVSKLDRGIAVATGEEGKSGNKPSSLCESSFAPIGQSPIHVINRLRKNGFDGIVDCTPMVKAVNSLDDLSDGGQPPELFDEYAAFRLHLCCYSIICASGVGPRDKPSISKYLNTKDCKAIFPWVLNLDNATDGSYRLYTEEIEVENQGIGDNTVSNKEHVSTTLHLSAIQSEDQEQVRNLFKSTYSEMFETYPSVKKLVKSALKTDLSARVSGVGNIDNEFCQSNCAIWNNYSKHHGSFWVVKISDGEKATESSKDSDDTRSFSKVVGCIGVKKSATPSISIPNVSTFYEINRLSVEGSQRGKGIGKLLLQSIEKFVRSKELSGTTIGLIASTPEVLEAANCLYSSNGFDPSLETQMGKMLIRTYVKTLE